LRRVHFRGHISKERRQSNGQRRTPPLALEGRSGRSRGRRARGRQLRSRERCERFGFLRSDLRSSSNAAQAAATPSALDPQNPWGGQRSDETLLTGDAASKVNAAALAKVDGATIVRVETDADGNAAYEAHIVKQDGTPATVYVDKEFDVASVESR